MTEETQEIEVVTPEPANLPNKTSINPIVEQLAKQCDEDFEFTRSALKELADLGREAALELKDIALETSQPFAYKVLAELIKSTGEIAAGVFEARQRKEEIDRARDPSMRTSIKDSTVFIGTTQDLLNGIDDVKEKQNEQKTERMAVE